MITCDAYDHRGTRRCGKPVTHRVYRKDDIVDRCEGHARKFRAMYRVERIKQEDAR